MSSRHTPIVHVLSMPKRAETFNGASANKDNAASALFDINSDIMKSQLNSKNNNNNNNNSNNSADASCGLHSDKMMSKSNNVLLNVVASDGRNNNNNGNGSGCGSEAESGYRSIHVCDSGSSSISSSGGVDTVDGGGGGGGGSGGNCSRSNSSGSSASSCNLGKIGNSAVVKCWPTAATTTTMSRAGFEDLLGNVLVDYVRLKEENERLRRDLKAANAQQTR